jgi:hypothetical protein
VKRSNFLGALVLASQLSEEHTELTAEAREGKNEEETPAKTNINMKECETRELPRNFIRTTC